METVGHIAKNTLQSVLFISTYTTVIRYLLCFLKNMRGKMDRWNVLIAALVATFAILFEPASRRNDLALYLIPKFLEAVWC